MRASRYVLAVWHTPAQAYLYPPFQFEADRVVPQLAALMLLLGSLDFADGWGEIEWLYCPHSLLGGRRPAEVFSEDPAAVLAVAQREFSAEQDANW